MKQRIFCRRNLIGLVVVVAALSLSGFTKHVETEKNRKFGTWYWFRIDPVTALPITQPNLIYQGYDPWWCYFLGLGSYCAAAYTSYTQDVYGYHAAGFQVTIHYNLPLPF